MMPVAFGAFASVFRCHCDLLGPGSSHSRSDPLTYPHGLIPPARLKWGKQKGFHITVNFMKRVINLRKIEGKDNKNNATVSL